LNCTQSQRRFPKKERRVQKPSKQEKALTIEDVREDTIAFFILDSIYTLLRAAVEVQGGDPDQAFAGFAQSSQQRLTNFFNFCLESLLFSSLLV
jgi:hypothetical protein